MIVYPQRAGQGEAEVTMPANRFVRILIAFGLAGALSSIGTSPAAADSQPTDPTDPRTPVTAAIDGLPTVQHNGVAWAQKIVGNRVYVAGRFTRARPAGSAPGQNETTRNNILAYDLTTGALVTSFNPNLNGQALAIEAAPDGSRIYVGGDFTSVGGAARSRIAALDPQTGAMVSAFNARADSSVRAIAATADRVYIGGSFSSVNGVGRQRVAALNAGNGQIVTTFNPTVSGNNTSTPRVAALQLSPNGDRIVLGGNFVAVNGSDRPGYGLAMLNTSNGASLPFGANNVVRNAGKDSAILSLASDGTNVYGTGYIYGTGGNLEGAFSASWVTGNITWVEDCHGDSYGVYPGPTAVYVAGHPHYCLNLGGYNETQPPQRAVAFSRAATGVLTRDTRGYPSFTGQPAPSLLNFFPQMTTGSTSGQGQAAWAVTGSGDYVVWAGEFKQVNGVGQQGLVRMAMRSLAPNKQGPKASGSNFVPSASSPRAGEVRLSWTANYDYDNSDLTYAILRDEAAIPVGTVQGASTWWSRPTMTYNETGVPGGNHTYRIKVTDPFGNAQTSPGVSVTVAGGAPTNQPPTASFTLAVNGNTVEADGRASIDSDGSIVSYAWSWGDGETGTGSTASHEYDANGTYTVTLTVTDNRGATGSTTRSAVIGTNPVVARDTFTRTVQSGFGSADVGGTWQTNGAGFSVADGTGRVVVSTPGQGPWAQLPGAVGDRVDVVARVAVDRRPNTAALYFGTIGRRVGSSDYRLKLRIDSSGAIAASLVRMSGGETTLASSAITGTYVAGTAINSRLEVVGKSPTTLRAKVWLGTGEPSAWQLTASDSIAALQAPGAVGLHTYVSGSSSNQPWTFRIDDFEATPAQ